MNNSLIVRLRKFMEYEARSCSMDFECVIPLYVYRMWGGSVLFNEIEVAMTDIRRLLYDEDYRPVFIG